MTRAQAVKGCGKNLSMMIRYEGSIWRPPSEADSLILQATVGCSHNACTFCVSYKKKKFKVRGAKGVEEDLLSLPADVKRRVKRVFLADGNALVMETDELTRVLRLLRDSLPSLERVGVYGYASDVRDKTTQDLRTLRSEGLGIVYLGIESGDDELLKWCRKGVTSEENVVACKKIREAGIPLSVTVILGLGGASASQRHALATADVLNRIDPEYVGALTLMIPPGTPLHSLAEQGTFVPMRPLEILKELHLLISRLKLTECVFRTNHASNYISIGGTLDRDRDRLLRLLEEVIDTEDESVLRPSYMRGL